MGFIRETKRQQMSEATQQKLKIVVKATKETHGLQSRIAEGIGVKATNLSKYLSEFDTSITARRFEIIGKAFNYVMSIKENSNER